MPGLVASFALTVALLAAAAPSGAAGEAEATRHLFYLHGRIVQEQQSARPVHPRFGAYELDEILDAFRDRGFVVHGGIRPKSASVDESAEQIVAQVRDLLAAGVAADHVTVVGASMGAAIAISAAAKLGEPELRYALLGACLSGSVADRRARGDQPPSGVVLSIRETSDEMTEPCPAWSGEAAPGSSLRVRELVIDTGLAHGFLYRPRAEWLEPVVDWARGGAQVSGLRLLGRVVPPALDRDLPHAVAPGSRLSCGVPRPPVGCLIETGRGSTAHKGREG